MVTENRSKPVVLFTQWIRMTVFRFQLATRCPYRKTTVFLVCCIALARIYYAIELQIRRIRLLESRFSFPLKPSTVLGNIGDLRKLGWFSKVFFKQLHMSRQGNGAMVVKENDGLTRLFRIGWTPYLSTMDINIVKELDAQSIKRRKYMPPIIKLANQRLLQVHNGSIAAVLKHIKNTSEDNGNAVWTRDDIAKIVRESFIQLIHTKSITDSDDDENEKLIRKIVASTNILMDMAKNPSWSSTKFPWIWSSEFRTFSSSQRKLQEALEALISLKKDIISTDATYKIEPTEMNSLTASLLDTLKAATDDLYWILLNLAKNEDVQSTLHAEVLSRCGSRLSSTFEKISNDFRFLDAVIWENMRMTSCKLWLCCYNNSCDSNDEEERVPNGTKVFVPSFAIINDESLFGPDTQYFVPERYLHSSAYSTRAEETSVLIHYFGRSDIYPIVQTAIRSILCSIVQHFSISLYPQTKALEYPNQRERHKLMLRVH